MNGNVSTNNVKQKLYTIGIDYIRIRENQLCIHMKTLTI